MLSQARTREHRGASIQNAHEHPCVSVVVPARNCAHTVDASLASLAAQDFDSFEVLVVDDGSTDATAQVVGEWCRRDARFRLLAQPSASAGAARNTGMAQAQGDYLLFLDADDVFEPGLLSSLHEAACSSGAQVCMCAADCFTSSPAHPVRRWDAGPGELAPGTYRVRDIEDHLFQAATVNVWNKLFDARFVREHGLAFQDQPRYNDAYFTLMALSLATTVCKIDEVLVHYRVEAGSSLVDQAAAHPLCDVHAFDAVRAALAQEGMLAGPLKRSLDTFCISTVVWRLARFARASEQATRQLFDAFYGTYRRTWGLEGARWPYIRSVRYALEYRLMAKAGPDSLMRAARADTRTRSSGRDVIAEARFALRLLREAWRRTT